MGRPKAGKLPFETKPAALWSRGAGLRPRTVELYEYLLSRHIVPQYGTTELAAITPAQIRAWTAHLATQTTIGGSTSAKCCRLLKTIMTTAVEDS